MKYFTIYYILGLATRFYTDTLQALHGAFCHGSTYCKPPWLEREVGGGIRVGNTCISMADSCQCMKKTTTIL